MQYEILVSRVTFAIDGDYGEGKREYEQGTDEHLETKVRDYIAQGWRPQGGVSTAVLREDENANYTVLQQFQAMVKD